MIDSNKPKAIRTDNYASFSYIEYRKKHFPNNKDSYTCLGIYFIVFTLSIMYSLHSESLPANKSNILIIYQIMMVTGVVLSTYSIWPITIRQKI